MKNRPVAFRQMVFVMIGLIGILALMDVGKGVWSIITTVLAVSVAVMAFRQVRRSLPSQPYILICYMATMTAWEFQQWALHAEHRPSVDILRIAIAIFTLCFTLYLWWKTRTGPHNSIQAERQT